MKIYIVFNNHYGTVVPLYMTNSKTIAEEKLWGDFWIEEYDIPTDHDICIEFTD